MNSLAFAKGTFPFLNPFKLKSLDNNSKDLV
jgi:hypothetical protein